MNRKGVLYFSPLIIIVAALLIGAVYYGYISVGSISSSDTIYTVDYGRLECLKDQSPEKIVKWADQDYAFTCGGYLLDECNVLLECSGTSILNPSCSVDYSVGGASSRITISKNGQQSLKLNPGDVFKVSKGTLFGSNLKYTKIIYSFNPYRLYTFEDGGKFISSSADCCLANQDELQKTSFKYGEWKCLEKSGANQFQNYFLNWKPTTGGAIYPYENKEVICRNNQLYELTRQKLADGSFRNIQGNPIELVECCPHQSNKCSSKTFRFTQESESRTCSYNYNCENSGNPWTTSSTIAKQEKCESGKCVEQEIKIECNSDASCRDKYGDGWGCSLTYNNFGKCIQIGKIEQPRCGDGYCQTGEAFSNCPEDCELNCGEGLKQVTTERKVNCAINLLVVKFGCDTRVEKSCEGPDNYWWLKLVLIVLVLIILIKFFPVIRGLLKGIPLIGRFIP